jgi:hypothetical protein
VNFNTTSGNYNINKIRFFANTPDLTMVAIFGQPSSFDDGWIANLHIEEVFAIPPNEFDLDRLYGINEFLTDAKLSMNFSSSPAIPATTLSDQQIVVYTREASDQSHQSAQPLAFFPHIPKAGGQTILDGFFRIFSRKKCLKIWDPRFGADASPKSFNQIQKQRFTNVSAVVGHLSMAQFNANQYCHSLLSEDRVRVFSCVREPIDRIISLYNYIKLSPQHPKHSSTAAMSLDEFALRVPSNYQYHFLALDASESITSIQSRIEIYQIQDSRQGLEVFFKQHFNATLPDLEIRNKSRVLAKDKGLKLSSIDDMSLDTIRDLKTAHHLDIDLWNASLDASGY